MARYYIDYCPPERKKPKNTILFEMFGEALVDIRKALLTLDSYGLAGLFGEYGRKYGANAAKYAQENYRYWASGSVSASGKTMERLIQLVPPYLHSSQRYELLVKVLKQHKSRTSHTLRLNLYNPLDGFSKLNAILNSLKHTDTLAYLPANVMSAAKWLYSNDMTAARAMLAQADRAENELIRAKAIKEIDQLKRLIMSRDLDSASYMVSLPSGSLKVETYTPFFHLKTFLPKCIARLF